MTSLPNMTPEEFNSELTSAIFDYFDGRGSERYHKARSENLLRLQEREAAMQIVEHWKFSPAADWSAETQSFAASVLLSAMQVARRGES